jgi:cephalosporin-C deacetylase
VFIDLPLSQLRTYRPDVAEPPDFDEFWVRQLAAARAVPDAPQFVPVATPLRHATVFDVTFPGYGGDPVKGWLLVPRDLAPDTASETASDTVSDTALVVEYIGYGGGRGDPLDWIAYSAAGHPHFVMDTRGQGGGWRSADTVDASDAGAPSTPGFMTRGIADPQGYYYTRLFVDAVRAIDAVRTHPVAASRRLATAGSSQGGALAIAAGSLAGDVSLVMPDVPFLANPRRAVEVTDSLPFGELIEYCSVRPDRVDTVFRTLSYVDVVNHAKRATAPALFSVGLLDDITPPSTVFTAFNWYGGDREVRKRIEVYPFNGHEGGQTRQLRARLAFLEEEAP